MSKQVTALAVDVAAQPVWILALTMHCKTRRSSGSKVLRRPNPDKLENTKFEFRKSKQIRNSNFQMFKTT